MATYIDFRKAFDCVQHSVLLKKMASFNIVGLPYDWVKSYLTNRSQAVLANGTTSPRRTILQGVPQGSVLGPLFYIMYANDLSCYLKKCNTALYADDTVLFTANQNFNVSMRKMQNDLKCLEHWCNVNGIKANIDKSKVMLFGGKNVVKHIEDFSLSLCGKELQKVSSYSYLGITLDENLNYGLHVQGTIRKASNKLKLFRRMRRFLNLKAAVLVYKNMLLPVIEHGDIFLPAATADKRKKLQTLQNKGLRCALGRDRFTSSHELHVEAKLLKLKYRRDEHILNYMYSKSFDSTMLKKPRTVGVCTRSQKKKLFKVRKPNTEKYKKSLAYKGPKKWNALPAEVQLSDNRVLFKNCIHKIFLSKFQKAGDSDVGDITVSQVDLE